MRKLLGYPHCLQRCSRESHTFEIRTTGFARRRQNDAFCEKQDAFERSMAATVPHRCRPGHGVSSSKSSKRSYRRVMLLVLSSSCCECFCLVKLRELQFTKLVLRESVLKQ